MTLPDFTLEPCYVRACTHRKQPSVQARHRPWFCPTQRSPSQSTRRQLHPTSMVAQSMARGLCLVPCRSTRIQTSRCAQFSLCCSISVFLNVLACARTMELTRAWSARSSAAQCNWGGSYTEMLSFVTSSMACVPTRMAVPRHDLSKGCHALLLFLQKPMSEYNKVVIDE